MKKPVKIIIGIAVIAGLGFAGYKAYKYIALKKKLDG